MKRSYTDATTQEDYTQEDMPARRRRSNSYRKNPIRSMVARTRQPNNRRRTSYKTDESHTNTFVE